MASRYTSYGLNFLRGLLLAGFLGPELFGVWGFLMLMQQYLSFTSFGLQYSVTVELATRSTEAHGQAQRAKYIGSVLAMTVVIAAGLGLLAVWFQASGSSLFEKYSFSQYVLVLSAIVSLQHFQQIFTNIYRVYGKLARVALIEVFSAAVLLLVILVLRDEHLINSLLITMLASSFLSIGIFVIRAPFAISFDFDLGYWRQLLIIGLPLLVYNLSFNLIAMSSRTIVSVYYTPEVMGYYSLANSITVATLLGLKAISWVTFPDILAKTHMGVANSSAMRVVQRVNDLYGTSVFIAVFSMILASPLLFYFLPQYQPAAGALSILLLSQAIWSLAFGYNCVIIARKKQMRVAGITAFSALLVIGLSLIGGMLRLDIAWIAVAVLVGTFVSTLWQTHFGAHLLGQHQVGGGYLTSVLPWGSLAATMILLVGILTDYAVPAGILGGIVFLMTSRRKLVQLWAFAGQKLGMPAVRS